MKHPVFTMVLQDGSVLKGELYPEHAPVSCANWIALANDGFYDGLIFHRVIPGFMIQGGDPNGTGMGGPGWRIKGEFARNGVANPLRHERGVLSMARSMHPDSAGSQFFIMVEAAPHLDGSYAAFGRVLEGMEAADRVVNAPTGPNDRPREPQAIRSIRVETFGEEYPVSKL
ncbi:MAG TPA: peptidylprolyl isomerase [Candidatus Avichristensenella intestinipullorum]|uniref:Peptidyl-prolyl cis-trans isomerase n=1 Tax=Candidatus Avichristensenella intestinipullorum TaxID=2840693 RepID=A0A9D0YUI0_9FIRM|nr:peptidylprolyl isomerase [Candidatus Avichristensenella intestinipullorum]